MGGGGPLKLDKIIVFHIVPQWLSFLFICNYMWFPCHGPTWFSFSNLYLQNNDMHMSMRRWKVPCVEHAAVTLLYLKNQKQVDDEQIAKNSLGPKVCFLNLYCMQCIHSWNSAAEWSRVQLCASCVPRLSLVSVVVSPSLFFSTYRIQNIKRLRWMLN